MRALFDGRALAGPHSSRWDGRSSEGKPVENGMYFARVRAEDREVSSRIAIVH